MTIVDAVEVLPVVMYLISHLVAIFGTPELVSKVKPLATIVDVVAANYGRAKNSPKQ